MEITWHGDTSIKIKGKNTSVAIDAQPFNENTASVMLFSTEQENPKGYKIIDWPGEYEQDGVPVVSMQAYTKPKDQESATPTLITKFEVDDVKFCHLGSLGHELKSEITDKIGDVDVLIVPVEQNLSLKAIHNIIEEIEPRAVLPVAYKDLSGFTKEFGIEKLEKQKSYTLKAASQLAEDRREYILLEPVSLA